MGIPRDKIAFDLKYCYSLMELSARWHCTENDILDIAVKQQLWLSVNLDGFSCNGYGMPPISGWWQLLIPSQIAGFYPENQAARFTHFRNPADNTYQTIKSADTGQPVGFVIARKSLVVTAEEVARYESENTGVFANNVDNPLSAQTSLENYFIRDGDHWRVRFNGGKEHVVGHLDGIEYLTRYLSSPNVTLSATDLYMARKCVPIDEKEYDDETQLSIVGSCNTHRDETKIMSKSQRDKTEEIFQELLARYTYLKTQGKHEEADEKYEEIETSATLLKAEYGVNIDKNTGKIISAPAKTRPRYYGQENVKRAFDKAIQSLQPVTGLVEHLNIFFHLKNNIYQPPDDFPQWYIVN